MEIKSKEITAKGIKLFIEKEGKEVARAYLYIMKNDLHKEPFGYMEDVYVDSTLRGQGLGTKLVEEIIDRAKEKGCYKLVATSRFGREKVHTLYERIGFSNHGNEFRIDFI